MKYLFITGIPAAGKSFLARNVANKTGYLHVDIDKLGEEIFREPKLKAWVDYFWKLDEEKYFLETSCEDRWLDLVKQSEAFWPTIERKIQDVVASDKPAIFEGVNLLPHLTSKSFNFPGFCILGNSLEKIFERNKKDPRWGKTEKLQRMEVEDFFNCERPKYKQEL